MSKKIQFYPIEIDSVIINNRDYIRIFGKTTDNKKICVFDQFENYFWVIPSKENIEWVRKQIENIKVKDNNGKIRYVKRAESHIKNFLGRNRKAIKVILNNSGDLRYISEEIKKIPGYGSRKEIDIPLYKKYLIDKKITPLTLCEGFGNKLDSNLEVDIKLCGKVMQISSDLIKNPKILSFDIETSNPLQSVHEFKFPIIMLSFAGSDGFRKCITWKSFENHKKEIEFVKNEEELLIRFKEIIKWYKPDYIVGYYSDGFDWPYIKARADLHGISLNLGLDNAKIKFSNKGFSSSTKILGIPNIDICKFIKNLMIGDVASGSLKTQSASLDSVAKEILNERKYPIDISKLREVWKKGGQELESYCLYNLKDAELCLRIFEKILPNINELVKLVGQKIYDVSRMTFGQLIENYLIKKTRDFNEIIPRRPTYNEREDRTYKTYTGGFVYEPKPGLYENIAVFDFRSLHPSIISAHNVCLSTLSNNKEDSNETPEIEGRKYYFNYKKEGFIPQIIRELIQRRMRIKQIIKENKKDPVLNARNYALKIIAAGFHGYLGYSGARWYSLECAEGILAYARDYIKKLIAKCLEAGFNIIYGDTDSVFIGLKNKNKNYVEKFLNDFNRDLPSLMELELENFYKRCIFVMKKGEEKGAKKKYALIDYENEIKVRGFETVRRDWSEIARETQNRILEIILKEGDIKKALMYVRDVINRLKEKKVSLDELRLQTQLKRNIDSYESISPHVAVAKAMRSKGIYVGAGTIVNYIISDGSGMIKDKAIMFEDATNYDSDYYINHQVIPAVEKIFEVLGYRKEDLISGEQTKLDEF